MGRTDKGGELNVAVNLTSNKPNYTKVFTVPGGVKFNAGEASTKVEVNYGDLCFDRSVDSPLIWITPALPEKISW